MEDDEEFEKDDDAAAQLSKTEEQKDKNESLKTGEEGKKQNWSKSSVYFTTLLYFTF